MADAGKLDISPMSIRATVAGIQSSSAYVTIANNGAADDLLLSVKSIIANKVEIHTMGMLDGVMRMRHVDGGLLIKAGEKLALAPGGLHIMLMGLNTKLVSGTQYKIILVFEKAGDVTVLATAKLPSEITSSLGMQKHDMN